MSADKLATYRSKRDPSRTPEPIPEPPARAVPAAKKNATRSSAEKATTTKRTAKKAATTTRSPAKKTAAKATATRSPAKKSAAKATATKSPAKKSAAKATATRSPAKKSAAKKSAAKATGEPGGSFVIQEHHARALHWDFRLERDGVLVSWALPKGLPLDPHQNHLAVHTEDHPLEYGGFAGEIPKGEYGGGTVTIWDHGTYDCLKWSDREVMVDLHGQRSEGRYVLFATGSRRRGGSAKDNWMIHRMDPPPADWQPMPDDVKPMLCDPGTLPRDSRGWAFEFKWDGARAIVYVDGGRVRIQSRNDLDVTASYPELGRLGEALGSRQVVLDGEIVALNEAGRPSFGVLQQRMHVADAARARRLSATVPVTYMIFDVLYLDGRPTMDLPYDQRRRLLESLQLTGSNWTTPPSFTDVEGSDIMAAADQGGLEGVVAKRRDSPYEAGRRSPSWTKVKRFKTQEVVIGGWSPGEGRRHGGIGALLLGLPDKGGLRYVGKVGTGFTDRILDDLHARLGALRTDESPFGGTVPRSQATEATWVRPELVGEVRFSEWTSDGRLRHPSWRGLRDDKKPSEVVVEG
ncbi:MAG TPA: non-homologous end-joining DNA ligase [Acidimicrobiales bacterium]|nr:non-homologous end-joining DNA ligase [Acidimicrobiales bacterium]